MNIEIILNEFTVPFSDLLDKELYEANKVEGKENTWVVTKKDNEK